MRKRTCVLWVLLILFAVILIASPLEVKADGSIGVSPTSEPKPTGDDPFVDWSQYSYDDLLLIRDSLNEYIHEAEVQYAIENGNRIITLSDQEVTLYSRKTYTLTAEVSRVVDDAPTQTTLKWKSSDESVAKVSNTGVITGIG